MTVHNHPPYRPVCNERVVDGQLRGACMPDGVEDARADALAARLFRARTEADHDRVLRMALSVNPPRVVLPAASQ